MIKRQYFLILIILIAAFLRLWQLGHVPLSLDWDEAALGYNAYSILHTGRDEFGNFLPTMLHSFGDYKPALYAYIIIPFLFIFDVSVYAVRLPSVLCGILSVWLTYKLVKELFSRQDFALLSAFLLAISPWHIQFSRVAFEANLALTCNLFMLYFFLLGIKRYYFLLLSVCFAVFGLYSYQSEKIFVPCIVLALIALFYKELKRIPKRIIATVVGLGIILLLPMLISLSFDANSLSRAKQTSIFAKQTDDFKRMQLRKQISKNHNDILGVIFNNKYIYIGKEMLSGYLSHLDPNWLFVTGDIERHHAPQMGLLYLFEFPFLLIGLYAMVFSKFSQQSKYLLFIYFLLAPLPASITGDVPHAVRTLNFLPTFQIFIAYGILSSILYLKTKPKPIGICVYFLLFSFSFFNFCYFLDQYFIQQNYFFAKSWQYGYKEIVAQTREYLPKYKKVIISDRVPMDQSYIFYLFFSKYDPSRYQRIAKRGMDEKSLQLDNLSFKNINWSEDSKEYGTLLIGTESDFPAGVRTLYSINYPDGSPGMRVVEVK